MWRAVVFFVFCVTFNCVFGSDESRVVVLADGAIKGDKYWNGEFYEFYGVRYATAPSGRDKFQAPLPPEPWEGVFDASKKSTICQQCYMTGESEVLFDGDEDCLIMNLLVPEVASEKNLLPVLVYIHSGAFSGGSGNMASFNYLARHDVITISFNYRLGALGFACLGNKEIPGNAGLKDQVAALRWINKNIKKFGGDPKQVTLAGFSVGATMAELLSLSKATTGLFNRIILDSGSALAPYAINRDPISTAKNIAISLGYNGTMTLEGLTEFYLNASVEGLAEKSVNYYLTNSTFGFAPCIENVLEDVEPILTESPLTILKKGENNDVAVLTGFADMEGLSRSIKFGTWREEMNEDFSNFLPADLLFENNKARDDFINEVKQYYFDNKPVNAGALQKYIDYFSDSMFKYNILKSAKLHASTSKKPVYLYEFSYTGKLNIEHHYMDRIKGASHRDQTAYILDFFGYTNSYKDLDTRDRLTIMWTDFVKYENPTPYESALINIKWQPFTNNKRHYMEINKKLLMKKDLFEEGYNFWNKVYEKYYWTPTAPKFEDIKEVNQEINTPKEKKTLEAKKTLKEKNNLKKEETVNEMETSDDKTSLKDKIQEEKDAPKEKDTMKEKNTSKQEETVKEKETAKKEKDTLQEKDTLKEKNIPIKEETVKEKDNKKKDKDVTKEQDPSKQKSPPKDGTSKEKITPKGTNTLKDKKTPKKDETVKEKETLKEKVTVQEKDTLKEKINVKEKDTLEEKVKAKEEDTLKEKDVPKKEENVKDTNTVKKKVTTKEKDPLKEKNISKENNNLKDKEATIEQKAKKK